MKPNNATLTQCYEKLCKELDDAARAESMEYYGATGFCDSPEAHDWLDALLRFGMESEPLLHEMAKSENSYKQRFAAHGLKRLGQQDR
jgi:hypothetical protein